MPFPISKCGEAKGASKETRIGMVPPRTYKPYETSSLDTPLFHLIVQPLCLSVLKPMLACIYRLRWLLSHPMHVHLLSRIVKPFVPARIAFLTVGEVVLIAPLIVYFIRGYYYTYVSPQLDQSGRMATYALYWAFFTANKTNSVFSFLFGIPFERMIPLHRLSALFAIVLTCFHVHVAYKYGGDDDGDSIHADFGTDPALFRFLFDGDTNFSGSFALGSIMLTVLLSLFPIIRRVVFNFWLISHILLALSVLISLFLHDVASAVMVTAWWALDLVVRYIVMAGCQNRVTAKLRRIGNDPRGDNEPAVEISFAKPLGFEYNAGQFVQIAIPKLSIFEFHPISISSAPHEDIMTLHIRKLGDWTSQLVKLADSTDQTQVWIEGPYGSCSVDLEDDTRYKTVLFVSGGIGVTPCQSIGKSLLYQHKTLGRNLKNFRFVWAVRNKSMVSDIPPLDGQGDYSRKNGKEERQQLSVEHSSKNFNSSPSSLSQGSQRSIACRRRPAKIEVDIYCTRGAQKDAELDEQSLPYNLYYGRPHLNSIFEETKQEALRMGDTNIAVVGCGPVPLMVDLQEACCKHSTSVVGCGEGVFFDFHKEHFEL